VPFWGRGADGRYRHLVTLNGFQLEALLRAAGELQAQSLDAAAIGRLLLPAAPSGDPAGFITRRGKVALRTVVDDGAAATTIAVEADGATVFRERFSATHLRV
jgi:hypothetical protein